ncbi:hypothetical protein [Agrococcus sp. ARC_14]|uniref:hypothetical protein n=1 Tax=Agrococcus sp. ARC_14 TaxID=2919927 RepID=UPI001F05BEDA|nr:hypothetical protein [Agrococcus sp. ARC_14]MCH1884240.1 hypothetical protein [Agrococcus sp. ARC_14]
MAIELLPSDADSPMRHRLDPTLHRIRRGAYVDRAAYEATPVHDRHELQVRAVAAARPAAVFARESALALARLPHGRPANVFTIGAPTASGRRGGVVASREAIGDDDIVLEDGIARCAPAFALAHLARVGKQADAVGALYAALRLQLVTKDQVADALGRQGPRGRRRAEWVIAFADPLSQSVGESWSRVAIHRIGAPPPRLQVRIVTRLGVRFPDFLWERAGMRPLGGEFDGAAKYGVIADANGVQPVDAVIEEKRRDDALREHIDTLHWMWAEAQRPERLRDMLSRHHLPVLSRLLPGW